MTTHRADTLIHRGAVACALWGAWSAIHILLTLAGVPLPRVDAPLFVDLELMLILAAGIYGKSRVCALLALLYFGGVRVVMFREFGVWPGLISVVMGCFLIGALWATVAYHRMTGCEEQTAAAPATNLANVPAGAAC